MMFAIFLAALRFLPNFHNFLLMLLTPVIDRENISLFFDGKIGKIEIYTSYMYS